jgi:hypothetical protein
VTIIEVAIAGFVLLVAVTVILVVEPIVAGGVYSPSTVNVPIEGLMDQLTVPMFENAVNCCAGELAWM